MRAGMILGLGCALITVLSGCRGKAQSTSGDGAQVRIGVETARVARRTLLVTRSFPGVLEAQEKADIAPTMPGRVKSLSFRVGDKVRKGEVVATMDDAALVAAIARFQPLKQQYDRSLRLFETNAISRSQFEGVEAEYIALKRQIEHLQENTTLRAPLSGVVTDITAEAGELFTPGMPRPGRSPGLVQIMQTDPLRVDLSVDDKTVAFLRKGMEVNLTCDVLPDTVIEGTVLWVNPSAVSASRTFPVRIVVSNARGILRAGFFVEARVILDRRENVLSVPRRAVLGGRVFVVHDSIAVARTVKTGWETGEFVEIISGLEEGVAVVTTGNRALPDSTVVIVDREWEN